MFKSKTLWTAVIMAALGVFLYTGKAGAACMFPLSASAADANDVAYFVQGADGVYRFTIQDTNNNGTFGFSSSTTTSLGGNPFAVAVESGTANGFVNSFVGTLSGYTNTAPYSTLPTGASGALSDISCASFCADNNGNKIASRDDRGVAGGDSGSTNATQDGCISLLTVRGSDGNIYRTAFKEGPGTFFAVHSGDGAGTGVLRPFDGVSFGDANADGFPGLSGSISPWVAIVP